MDQDVVGSSPGDALEQAMRNRVHACHHGLEDRGTIMLLGPRSNVGKAVARVDALIGGDHSRGRLGHGLAIGSGARWVRKMRLSLASVFCSELEALVLCLTKENPTWDYGKLEGELLKLGYAIGRSTVRDVLKRKHVPPAPERAKHGSSWRTFLAHSKHEMLACDFFTVETAWLKSVYVLFFIELESRRVHLAGCPTNPTSAWVTQQARNLSWQMQDHTLPVRFLNHDRDSKFPAALDIVFTSEEVTIIRTQAWAPNANAFAKRWVRSVREECLDKILVLSDGHLRRVLTAYVSYYKTVRPHQGMDQQCPIRLDISVRAGQIERRDIWGGVLHDDYWRAA